MAINLKEWHHGYLGLILFIIGCLINSLALVITGFALIVDDIIFHISGWSPLHALYALIYHRSALVRAINAWFDRLFGRKE